MNPVAVPTAWGPQSAIYGDPAEDDPSRRKLEAWGAAPGAQYEQRALAASLILNSHSDQLNLSHLGLTEIPPLPSNRSWRRVDLRGNPLGPLPAWADAMTQSGKILCDAPRPAASSGRRPDVRRAATLFASTKTPPHVLALLRRAALHQPHLQADEIAAIAAASPLTHCRAANWARRHAVPLRALMAVCPRTLQDSGASYARRLHLLDRTLDSTSLAAMTRCQTSHIPPVLRRLQQKEAEALDNAK